MFGLITLMVEISRRLLRSILLTETLRERLLETELLGVGDLILAEVLQGFRQDKNYQTAKRLLTSLTLFEMLGVEMAMKSADNFRDLRKKGITVRKTIDVMIATFCIENGHKLLFSDKDFAPFVEHLGLMAVE